MEIKLQDSTHQEFIAKAHVAAARSRDNSRKVGSVIVSEENDVRSIGWNSIPEGVDQSSEHRHDRDTGEKYFWYEHAERNAIYSAARSGTPLLDCRMYITNFPCADCARAIIQSGIRILICPPPPLADTKFNEHYRVAKQMFKEAGIEHLPVDSSGANYD